MREAKGRFHRGDLVTVCILVTDRTGGLRYSENMCIGIVLNDSVIRGWSEFDVEILVAAPDCSVVRRSVDEKHVNGLWRQ